MPNWCENEVTISGQKEDLEKITALIWNDSNKFDFNKITKMPKDESDWYSWCLVNWGTKWNSHDVELCYNGKRTLKYIFMTAWTPPIPVIRRISEKFPNVRVTLKYWECNNGFKGHTAWKNGIAIKEGHGAYYGHRGG